MSAYFESYRKLIGKTPLVRLPNIGAPEGTAIFVKLELMNPGGSVKDRIGAYMLKGAEERGELGPGATVIEATAGNTGIGIAFAALNSGHPVIFAVPEKFSAEKQIIMRALGAQIVHTPESEGMLGAVRKAEELRAAIPGSVMLGQFDNRDNPLAHYETTGPEIYDALDGKIAYFVCGAGSGGTFSGIMKYFHEKNPQIRGVLADPVGSTIGGGEHAPYKTEGIGNDFIAGTMNMEYVDRVIKVNDEQAFAATRELAAREGIIAGSSTGAALFAALTLAREGAQGNIVIIAADRGERYFSEALFE